MNVSNSDRNGKNKVLQKEALRGKVIFSVKKKSELLLLSSWNKREIWYKKWEFPSHILFSKHFRKCQEEKCSFSASLFDCIIRWESSFPFSSSLPLSSLMMTNMTRPSSNRNFREDKCVLYFSRTCLRLLSQPKVWQRLKLSDLAATRWLWVTPVSLSGKFCLK